MAVRSRKSPVRSSAKKDASRERSENAGKGGAKALRLLEEAVESIGKRLHSEKVLRPGLIVFRTGDGSGQSFTLRTSDDGVQIQREQDHTSPLLEIIGEPSRIHAILRGDRDARAQFFRGGLRVRGDMHYLSDLGMRLGFLQKPIV
jgi:hypothetical protein